MKLTAGDPSVREWVEKYSATIDEDIRMLRTLNGEENAKLEIPARVKKMRGLIRQAGLKNETLMSVMRENQTMLDALRDEELEAQEYVRTIVVLGLVSNFAIAMILILLVVKDVKGRLQVLLNNAHLLPKSVPLTDRVSGRDELSELDEEMHAASAQLIEAADYRRGLMQMMAHDLRSPLSACMVSLEMLSESDVEFGAREKKQIKAIDRNLKTSVELISDLLLLEILEVGNLALEREPENLSELVDTAALIVGSLASVKRVEIKNETLKEYVTSCKSSSTSRIFVIRFCFSKPQSSTLNSPECSASRPESSDRHNARADKGFGFYRDLTPAALSYCQPRGDAQIYG